LNINQTGGRKKKQGMQKKCLEGKRAVWVSADLGEILYGGNPTPIAGNLAAKKFECVGGGGGGSHGILWLYVGKTHVKWIFSNLRAGKWGDTNHDNKQLAKKYSKSRGGRIPVRELWEKKTPLNGGYWKEEKKKPVKKKTNVRTINDKSFCV